MKTTKKLLGVLLSFIMLLSITTGCSSQNTVGNSKKVKELTFCESWNFDESLKKVDNP